MAGRARAGAGHGAAVGVWAARSSLESQLRGDGDRSQTGVLAMVDNMRNNAEYNTQKQFSLPARCALIGKDPINAYFLDLSAQVETTCLRARIFLL